MLHRDSLAVPSIALRSVCFAAEAVGGSAARSLSTIIRSGDWNALPSFFNDFSWSSSDEDPFSSYFFSEVLSKADFFAIDGINRKEAAMSKFVSSEDQCRSTNARVWKDSTPITKGVDAGTVILMARRKISSVLGRFSWDDAEKYFGFGPGATLNLPRRKSTYANKIGIKPTVTPGCLELARTVLSWYDLWGFQHLEGGLKTVCGNKIVTVPKNFKSERVIAIEPLMNSFVQKGIGGVIRNRLRRVGIDLNDQTRNQRLACQGSRSRDLATVDLSSASDTLASDLVYRLLPSDWYDALALCRSPRGVLPSGKLITYQKFSSMGNGYTFELESLIFWALSSVCYDLCGKGVTGPTGNSIDTSLSVYGDDIIVSSDVVGSLFDVLKWAGFTPNRAKTHFEDIDPFRESCGKHYLDGRDITPFYIRKECFNLDRKIWLANSYKRLAYRKIGAGYGLDASFLGAHESVVDSLPRHFRKPLIPDGYGDGALVGDFDEVQPSRPSLKSKRSGWDGWITRHWVRKFKDVSNDPYNAMVATMLSSRNMGRGTNEHLSLRSLAIFYQMCERVLKPISLSSSPTDRSRLVSSRLFVHKQWQNLGPWIG